MSASEINEELDEDTGPSIDSSILEERIAARRLRIAKRLEALKREALGDSKDANKISFEPEKELSKSRKQIEESFQRLSKLISDGNELVSNIEVACDARESALRNKEDENSKERDQKLADEVKAAAKKFEEISKKWEGAVKKDIPQQLQQILSLQKESCDEMISEKDKLIDDLQQDLKQKDDQYVKDLRKQAEDVDLMIERMDEQMKSLYQAYKQELDVIEESFYSERRDLLKLQKNKWNHQTESRRQKEVEYMELRLKHVEDYEEQLKSLRIQDAEEYNMVKIKLETDVQILEQNLQQMKATYQLNQEKLEYNFQVLKKRDEENTITKSQQKRKITRLQDLLNNLKQKLKKQEQQYSDENQAYSDDLKRMTEQYKELQKKFRHFQATDNKKFVDVWTMNEEQVKELINDTLTEDRIIYEHQLGLDWESPTVECLSNIGPLRSKKKVKSDQKTALDVAQEVLSVDSREENGMAGANSSNLTSGELSTMGSNKSQDPLSTADVKKMLELLCDESGFLVEAKLLKLLAPIERDERSLMKLDAIFNAIGIETEADIMLLGKYLYKARTEVTMEAVPTTEDLIPEEDSDEAVKSVPVTVIKQELIHPNSVIKALRQFVEENREPVKESKKLSAMIGMVAHRDSSKDEVYWRQLAAVIDEKKERVWDAIILGFEKYSDVLKERSTLILDTDSLRQQNSELRMLLHQYLSSKVNQELEIPPTRVLQLEVSNK